MAIRGGPDIIEDGLVLHLDAAEPLCFRGEPTTNLASYTSGNATRGSWPYGAYTHSIETTGEFAGWEKIVATSVGSATSNYVMHLGNFAATSGVQYTGSIEFYSPYNNLMFHITGGQGIGDATRIGSSNKYHRTFATTISTNMAWYLKTIASTPANTAISNGVIYYRRAQFEQKSYYTDFTIGTRGSTVATGGGLLDLTNNGNDGIINRTTSPSAGFYNASNGGSFVFDGSNDYATYGALPGSFSSFTVISWFYPTSITNYENVIDCNYGYNGTTGNIGPRLEIKNNGAINWVYSNITNNNNSYYGHAVVSSGLSANVWHCVGITYNAGTNTSITYYNGNSTGLSRSSVGSPTGFIGVMNGVNVGKGFHLGGTERMFTGKISNCSIYNRALSPQEIQQNYNATKGRFGL